MSQITLSENDRREIVKYRIEKAGITYEEAMLGIKNGFVGIAANRLYYAAYYAVSALLIAYGITVKSHDGVKRMFGMHFLKNKRIDLKYGQVFNLLYSLRLTGDYQDRKNLDLVSDVMPLVEPANELINIVCNMAKDKIGGEN